MPRTPKSLLDMHQTQIAIINDGFSALNKFMQMETFYWIRASITYRFHQLIDI